MSRRTNLNPNLPPSRPRPDPIPGTTVPNTSLALSVLVVNYRGAGHLTVCLTALEQQTLPRHRFEVIVVDNASNDGSAELLRTRFPWCRCIASPRNLGFAGGNNLGATAAHAPRLVLLNNDTIPDPYFLEEILRTAEASPGQAVVAKLVFAHDSRLIQSAGLILLRDGRGADRGFRAEDRGQFEATELIFAGCGAALAIPTPRSGQSLFDPRLFMYYEDLDLGWQAVLAGFPTVYAPRALVRHVHGAAAGDQSPLFAFHVERNRALINLRNADPVLAVITGAGLFAKVVQAVIRAIKPGPDSARRWSIARAVGLAAVSYLLVAPRMIVERYDARLSQGGAG